MSEPAKYDRVTEERHNLEREYDDRVYAERNKRTANKVTDTEANRKWREERDYLLSHPYTEEAEARRQESLKLDAALRSKRQKSESASGGRRMRYKSTRRRGKTNRRRVKTHRRRHRKH